MDRSSETKAAKKALAKIIWKLDTNRKHKLLKFSIRAEIRDLANKLKESEK